MKSHYVEDDKIDLVILGSEFRGKCFKVKRLRFTSRKKGGFISYPPPPIPRSSCYMS